MLVEARLPGQTLGWSGLIPPHVYTLKAVAAMETELLVLPRSSLLSHFSDHPRVGYTVLSNLAMTIGERLQLFQTIWVREMQRTVGSRSG